MENLFVFLLVGVQNSILIPIHIGRVVFTPQWSAKSILSAVNQTDGDDKLRADDEC